MQNTITASSAFKNSCKDFKSSLDHNVVVYNVTKAKELNTEDITVDVKEKSRRGNTRTDKVNFNLILPKGQAISDLIKEGDKVELRDEYQGEEITFFTGYAQKIPEEHKNLENIYEITLYDRIQDGIEAKFQEDEVLLNQYFCNNSDKANSLAHQLAYRVGFLDSELEFDEVKNPAGDYLVVPFTYWKEGDSIFSEFEKLVKAVQGKLFMNYADKLIFTNPFNEEDYSEIAFVFDNNVRRQIKKEPVPAEYDQIKIEYSQFEVRDKKVVWQYIENEDNYDKQEDKANILLQAGDSTPWIKFGYVTDIAIELDETPVTLFEDQEGNSVTLDYDLEFDKTGGRVKFTNNNTFDVYIQRFKIKGKPLFKHEGNETTYTEVSSPSNPMSPISNKYIQDSQVAALSAQYAYHINCRDRIKYEAPAFYTPFLQLSNKVTLDNLDLNDEVIIKKFKHELGKKKKETTVQFLSYIPYEFDNSIIDSVQSRMPDFEMVERTNDIRDNAVNKYDSDPPAPMNVTYSIEQGQIFLEWDEVSREDVKGYSIIISSDNSSTQKFIQANNADFSVKGDITYTIEIKTVTFDGKESDITSVTAEYPKPDKPEFTREEALQEVIKLRWTDLEEDEVRYELRTDDNFGADDGLLYYGENNSYTFDDISSRSNTFYLKAVNPVGYNDTVTQTTVENPQPAKSLIPDVSTFFEKIKIAINKLNDQTIVGYYIYITDSSGTEEKKNAENLDEYEYSASPGTYDIQVAAYDVLGEGPKSDPVTVEIEDLAIPEESIEESDLVVSLQKEINQIGENESKITQLSDEITLKVQGQDADGNPIIGGIGVAVEDESSEVSILADQFKVFADTNDTGKAVFAVDESGVYITENIIADGAITADKLRTDSIEAWDVEFQNAKISGEVLMDTIGENASAAGTDAVAIGKNANAAADNTLAIGRHSHAVQSNAVAIGGSITEDGSTIVTQAGNDAIALGYNAQAEGAISAGIGYGARANSSYSIAVLGNAEGKGGVAVGWGSKALEHGIAIGKSAEANAVVNNSDEIAGIAIGRLSSAVWDAIGIGDEAKATGIDSIAIGDGASANAENTVAIGRGVQAEKAGEFVLGNRYNLVKIPGIFSTAHREVFYLFSPSGIRNFKLGEIRDRNCRLKITVIGAVDFGNRQERQTVVYGAKRNDNIRAQFEVIGPPPHDGDEINIILTETTNNVNGDYDDCYIYARAQDYSKTKIIIEHTGEFIRDFKDGTSFIGTTVLHTGDDTPNARKEFGELIIAGNNIKGVPVGSLIWHAGGIFNLENLDGYYTYFDADGSEYYIPEGFLVADGSILPKSDYERLWSIYGHIYEIHVNTSYDKDTKFPIPDFRGEFIRGLDMGRGIDPDNRSLGDQQDDQSNSISHFCTHNSGASLTERLVPDSGSYSNKAGTGRSTPITKSISMRKKGVETRSKNVSLIPIIKY